MDMNLMYKVKAFTNDFIDTIVEENEPASTGYEWDISFHNYDLRENMSYMKVVLTLCDGDGEEVGVILYDNVKDKQKGRIHKIITFSFGEVEVCDTEETSKEFEKIKNVINNCEIGAFDKMCEYVHKYAMKQMDLGKTSGFELAPTYKSLMS